MNRRGFLAATATVLAMPRVARSQEARILRFIPQVDRIRPAGTAWHF